MVLAGVLSMAVHWGMVVPIRQYFQSSIFFVDFLLIGAVVFYLLCNSAYCAYETLWREREEAQDAADVKTTDADVLEQRALRRFRKKRAWCVVLFLAAVAVPALLQSVVFSDRVMGQAQRQY